MTFPAVRLRRLRENALVRKLAAETKLDPDRLIYPIFIKEGVSAPASIGSMPGQFQWPMQKAVDETTRLHQAGLKSVILFGIPARKDLSGKQAVSASGVIQRAVRLIKKKNPSLLVMTDVCLCEYLSHGHCGVIQKRRVENDPTLQILAAAALSHARAGADIVAPSDMMDGRVGAIRKKLDSAGFQHTPILSYAVKYASAYYAPFRDAAESAPQFGDRRGYQMNPANRREAMREAALDLQEGADMLMVKPALGYEDILFELKLKTNAPVGAYSVSGEYAMIKAAAQNGWIDEKRMVIETHQSLIRAGADFIVTYWAKELMKWLPA